MTKRIATVRSHAKNGEGIFRPDDRLKTRSYRFETIGAGKSDVIRHTIERFADQIFEDFVNQEENIVGPNALNFHHDMPICE